MVKCNSDNNMSMYILLGMYKPIRDPLITIQKYLLKGAVITLNKILTVYVFQIWKSNNESLTHFILDAVSTMISDNQNLIGTLTVDMF